LNPRQVAGLCKDDINQYSRAMEVPLQQEAME
jgi:hypothetical protein